MRRKRSYETGENCMMRCFIISTPLNNIRVIMPRRMGLMEHIACMRDMRNSCKLLVGKPEEWSLFGRITTFPGV
jgi:hypothetical protein